MPRDKTANHVRLMAAARQEFLEYGYEKASMRSIGERCGMTAAGLYRHCRNKEDLFDQLVMPCVQRIEEWLTAHIARYVDAVWDRQEEDRKLTGRSYSDSEHICQWPDGTAFHPDYVSRRFQKVLECNHLPKIRFHDLRHTAGSLLVNQGHTIKQVQEFLGHEKASTTLDIYTHISLEGKRNTAQVLDELLA